MREIQGRRAVKFKVSESLSNEEVQRGLKYVVRDGVASQSMAIFTGGAFLIAFAVKLGASNFVIGLLAAVGPLAQLLQLPSILLVERLRNRRAIAVISAGIGRLFWLPIILIPFVFNENIRVPILLVSLGLSSALAAVSSCSWNSWMRDLIPQNILGAFFSRRMRISTGVGIVLSFLAAFYVDNWKKLFAEYELQGYSILFLAGLAAGMLGIYFLSRIPEKRMAQTGDKPSLLRLFGRPFRDENFRKLITFLCSWNFAVNLAGPFFMVYMLRRLGLSMSLIIGLGIVSQVMNFAFLRIWGKFTDLYSNKSVLAISGPLFIFSILAWVFTTMPEKYFLTVPLLILIHILMGLSSAGVSLATGNISLKLAPEGQATAYLATSSVFGSLAAGIAPILGGKFADFFAGREIAWTLKYTGPVRELSFPTLNIQQWDFFFLLAFLAGLYSLRRLAKVKEVGEVEEKVVMNQLFAEVKGQVRILSSVEGLRQMISFPFSLLRDLGVRKDSDVDETD